VAALTSKVEAHLQAMGFDINPKIN